MTQLATMKLTRRNNTLYLCKRVPRRFRAVEDREIIWISLHTDSEAVANQKAPTVWAEHLEAWEAKIIGASDEAERRLSAAKSLAARRGYRFMQAEQVAELPVDRMIDRIEATVTSRGRVDILEADAILGVVELAKLTVRQALKSYWTIAKDKVLGKSEDQIRRWENPRKKAVENFCRVIGDLMIAEITTNDLMRFREWWIDRIAAGEVGPNSANKDMVHLFAMIRDVARANDVTLRFNTERMMIDEGKKAQRPAFSRDWISSKLLAAGALDGLNPEARAILLGMINTGYRPSEGASLTAAQIRLDVDVPHIKIEAVGRVLKSHNAERTIPLVGVSLEAFKAFPNGFPRYADNPALSDTINKFLRENKLLETANHTLYGLRHSFEDRMLEAGIDNRIRADLMGHSIDRERYGQGASLVFAASLLQKIAL